MESRNIMSNSAKVSSDEIDKTVKRYIVLTAPTKKIAEELLEWWSEDN